ncbi:formylglycine-generating enzyme family protein [Pontibacterium sp. N1Y112]|uniref:Formylglycine-generating enzyme family protein n=1 Tax=Pontibacterium sinense TaxID=2781979 RepID=A0A8J7FG32_9GAMM|nr:formylglycine-generating enzyme family protein [Pontibacterium sinense]MBE9398944.1 formylglycine-generating enzyme family protein [Pontibacterium sinense]
MTQLNISHIVLTSSVLLLSNAAAAAPDYKEMVSVPAGEFEMGCKTSDGIYCLPGTTPHKVYLDAFKIDKHLVTFDRYQSCIDAGSCTDPYMGAACNYGMPWAGNHPVNCITYKQAEDVCRFENKRLPTEAEWAKAARGPSSFLFPWGNAPAPSCDRVVMNEKRGDKMGPGCGAGTTLPVGSKPEGASPYGALDMAGNLFEWTSDWYSETYFANSPVKNPKGPEHGEAKVLRGSAWTARFKDGVALTVRSAYAPLGQGYVVGARCAASSD